MAPDVLDILRVQDEPETEPVFQAAEWLEIVENGLAKFYITGSNTVQSIDISDPQI